MAKNVQVARAWNISGQSEARRVEQRLAQVQELVAQRRQLTGGAARIPNVIGGGKTHGALTLGDDNLP